VLVAAIADVLGALDGLDSNSPFSATVLTRGLLEASADLFWLSHAYIDSGERTRRTCVVFPRQHETQVRQMVQFAKRHPDAAAIPNLAEGISEGWESLKATAEAMAAIGFKLGTNKKPGAKYTLDEPKPTISELVDVLITRLLGKTGVNLYSIYSSIAHAEGEGSRLVTLGSTLRVMQLRRRSLRLSRAYSGSVQSPIPQRLDEAVCPSREQRSVSLFHRLRDR
jgi:hypothetical protein